jgi:phosphoribosylaminoimidazolecarboxamide formyltransferase/IMP cyclohydrolase
MKTKTNRINTVLISVSDKTGVVELARGLSSLGAKIISTGNTAKSLAKNGIKVSTVEQVTGFPEILDGRVKTLHPNIHSGILAERNSKHLAELKKHNIGTIDAVVVNFYPFASEKTINNIDIGGVALLRAAAKNFKYVLPVCDPADYENILEKIKTGTMDLSARKRLAAKAFSSTAYYDSIIADYLSSGDAALMPQTLVLGLKKTSDLRYGENPHQKAAIYSMANEKESGSGLRQVQGKELSYNNYLDLTAARSLVCELKGKACAIVKHGSPCGAALGSDALIAYKDAFSCDPVSAFGGIVAFNCKVDGKLAGEIIKAFTECVIAPGFDKKALSVFSAKKNLRIIEVAAKTGTGNKQFRSAMGNMLVQENDSKIADTLKFVTEIKTDKKAIDSLIFAFTIAKYVKSNAIVLVRGKKTVGIGAGQMSRIGSMKVAVAKMKSGNQQPASREPLVLASDAFFPFRDVVDEAAKIGVKAIIQTGGSVRDGESIQAGNEYHIPIIFTGIRHFRH